VIQNPPLELHERRPGLDPQLVHQHAPGGPEGLERVGLSPRSIQREHQLGARALAVAMLGDQRLEAGNHVQMPAELELRLDLLLERDQAKLVESRRLYCRKGLVAKLAERLPAHEPKRLRQLLRGDGRTSTAGLREKAPKALDVELVAVAEQKPIAAGVADDSLRTKPLAQRRDVTVQRLSGSGRRPLAPEPVDQFVGGDNLPDAQQEQGQERALLRARRRQHDSGGLDLEHAQQPELHWD
jgi:hypothetical protein